MIDLRSDTLSMPTEEMLRAIQTAPLGDDSRDGDPTVVELEGLSAEMLGKEAGAAHRQRHDVEPRRAADPRAARRHRHRRGERAPLRHGVRRHRGGAAACSSSRFEASGGAMDPEDMRAGVPEVDGRLPGARAACASRIRTMPPAGRSSRSRTWTPASRWRAITDCRYTSTAPASSTRRSPSASARESRRPADSVSFCLSKGLSAPVGLAAGRVHASSSTAHARIRRALGGTMRQAGIIAAPGLVALRTMVDGWPRITRTRGSSATALAVVPGLAGRPPVRAVQHGERGRLAASASMRAAFAQDLDAAGVRGLPGMGTVIRFVTYRGITREQIDRAIAAVRAVVTAKPWMGAPVTA